MKLLDNTAETLPYGLSGTPFETVYKALRSVASQVWAVDPLVYRAGMGWGWYALNKPELLVSFRDVVTTALISAVAPVVKASQTDAELVEYLRQWREYTPTFPKLQNLYTLFGATVDIQPISDPESQAVIPVEDTTHAFYVRITSVDMSRPLTLSEAYDIAIKASPLGSRPFVYYAIESRIDTSVAPAPIQDTAWTFVTNNDVAGVPEPPPPPPSTGFIFGGLISETSSSQYTVTVDEYLMNAEVSLYGIMPPFGGTMDVEVSLYGVMPPMGGMVSKPIELPSISLSDDFGENYGDNYLYADTSGINVTVSSGGTTQLMSQYSGVISTVLFDSSKSYAIQRWGTFNSGGVYGINGVFSITQTGGNLFVQNDSPSSADIYWVLCAVCSSNAAAVVQVYDTNTTAYNAFKYTANGTDYYYVLDGTQTAWVSDLSSIGYSLTPLPYVETTLYLDEGVLPISDSVTSATTQITKSENADTVYQLYLDSDKTIPFEPDFTKRYEIGRYDNGSWNPDIQDISDLPNTVSSSSADAKIAYILLNSGNMWIATNWNTMMAIQSSGQLTVRVYPDDRAWTSQTLYLVSGNKTVMTGVSCYSLLNNSTRTYYQLYTDSGCTTAFYYDLDKEYRIGSPNRIQSVWDMPKNTGSEKMGYLFNKLGKYWYAFNKDSDAPSIDETYITVWSTPKQYNEPTITLDLGFVGGFSAQQFSSSDYWFSFLRNDLDKEKAFEFGLPQSSDGKEIGKDLANFYFELIALCDQYEETVLTDMSNFYFDYSSGTNLRIRSVNAYSTRTNYWRARFTKMSGGTTKIGYYFTNGTYFYKDVERRYYVYHLPGLNYTAISAIEHLSGGGTNVLDASRIELNRFGAGNDIIYPDLVQSVSSNSMVEIEFAINYDEYIDVLFLCAQNGIAVDFDEDDWWYARLVNSSDKQMAAYYGLVIYNTGGLSENPIYSDNYTYEITGVYTDSAGTVDAGVSLDNFYCGAYAISSNKQILVIKNYEAVNGITSWRCRIRHNQQ